MQSIETFSFRQLSCSRITAYHNNAICSTWPKDVMFTNHIFACQVQWIFDYCRVSVKRSEHFENRFFKLSFHIFFRWNYQLFYFYIIKQISIAKFCTKHACASKWMNRASFRSILGTSVLGTQVQSKSLNK